MSLNACDGSKCAWYDDNESQCGITTLTREMKAANEMRSSEMGPINCRIEYRQAEDNSIESEVRKQIQKVLEPLLQKQTMD